MNFDERIRKINEVLKEYFDKRPFSEDIPAKDFMPNFVCAEIYKKDHKKGLPLRKDLRRLDSLSKLHLIPFLYADRKKTNTKWYFMPSNTEIPEIKIQPKKSPKKKSSKTHNINKDEYYVLDLCDDALNLTASRQHTFDFLLGDLHKDGVSRTKLPVDAYYESLNLVVEFLEKQHTEPVTHFDKPDIMTVSGVSRGEQRKIYDQRRNELIPKNNIGLITISYSDFEFNSQKIIVRNKSLDLEMVKNLLSKYIGKD